MGGLKLTCAVLCQRLLGRKTPGSERDKPAQGIYWEASACPVTNFIFRPDIKQDYPPNLSILISGGKENNCDSLSNGE